MREVRAKLSEVLRAVERGEVVRITSRGRTVAEIAPPRSADEHLEALIRTGQVTPPSRPRGPLPKPHPGGSASQHIFEEREQDR